MRLAELPEAKTYDPAGRCIYCGDDAVALGQEHIIPLSLGGEAVIPEASCTPCAEEIKKYESDCLNWTFIQARTFLKLPMYKPKYRPKDLRLGAFESEESIPKDLTGIFRWENIPTDDHPASILLPGFALPGLLRGTAPDPDFKVMRTNFAFLNGQPPSHIGNAGERAANLIRINPDAICRFMAKIAHGAAYAELGPDRFNPMLCDLIRNRANCASHLVGSPTRTKWPSTTSLHQVSLHFESGYVVARVRLFSRYRLPPYLVVVGTLKESARSHFHSRVR